VILAVAGFVWWRRRDRTGGVPPVQLDGGAP
jgi:hypothetical protein